MIGLARSDSVRRMVQRNRLALRLAGQFVGGRDVETAWEKARHLKNAGFQTSLFYLGEYVDVPELIEENVRQIEAVIAAPGQAKD